MTSPIDICAQQALVISECVHGEGHVCVCVAVGQTACPDSFQSPNGGISMFVPQLLQFCRQIYTLLVTTLELCSFPPASLCDAQQYLVNLNITHEKAPYVVSFACVCLCVCVLLFLNF